MGVCKAINRQGMSDLLVKVLLAVVFKMLSLTCEAEWGSSGWPPKTVATNGCGSGVG